MYEDFHLESDYEDRNGNLLELDDSDMYDEYSLTDEYYDSEDMEHFERFVHVSDEEYEARYSGSWQDSDISNESDFIDF